MTVVTDGAALDLVDAGTAGSSRDLGADLLDVIGPVRRVLRRRLRRDRPEGGLPQAQAELLGVVGRQPGLRVQEAAAALQLASNSVSTLVNQLVAQGLVQRDRDPADRRSAFLALTPAGEETMAARRDFRRQLVGRSLDRLEPTDRRHIEAAIPALRRLAVAVEEDR